MKERGRDMNDQKILLRRKEGKFVISGTIRDFLGYVPAKSFKGAKISVRHEDSKVIITI